MGKRTQAFIDGLVTGADFLGTTIGYATKARTFGYIADRYSLFNPYSSHYEPFDYVRSFSYQNPQKVRNLEEQIFKGVGDSVGLASNILLLLPQIVFIAPRSLYHVERKILDKLGDYFAKQKRLPFNKI